MINWLKIMSDQRKQHLSGVSSVVVKLGSQLLSNGDGRLDGAYLGRIATQVAALREKKIAVTLVSSGALAAGCAILKLSRRPTDLPTLQAAAAVGQRKLMDAWADAFEPHGLPVAQLLLTREDINHRTRYLHLRNTIHAVHGLGAIPIINENDTISTDELIKITFGDNDILAATVAHALRAKLLVLMSVVDGLLDKQGAPVRLVENVEQARQLVRAEKSALGKGGMNSKLEAARTVTVAGEPMAVVDGRMENVLLRLLDGDEVGTLFAPKPKKRTSRSRWIGSVQPAGGVVIDAGAVAALRDKHKSLLPAGVVKVDGHFNRGDVIAVTGPDGALIGRGLSNYDAGDMARIRGKKTRAVRELLGDAAYDEVIHCDNLVLG